MSLQIHQILNTSRQYSKNYIGFQSDNASITNCVFLHIKHFKFSNLPIFTIVYLFLLILCLQDHLIHRFCPSHMSEHLWVKGPFLSLLQDSGTSGVPRVSGARGEDENWRPLSPACRTGERRRQSPLLLGGGLGRSPSRQRFLEYLGVNGTHF